MRKLINQKKGDAGVGWGVIVLLILGIMLLLVLILIAAKSKGGFTNIFENMGNIFG